MSKLKPNYKAILNHSQRLISDGKASVDLPREVADIFEDEDWKHFTSSKGKPFDSFIDFVKARQPYGLGVGQYNGWINAAQLWQLCSGHGKVRAALLPLAAEQIKPIAGHGTNQHGGHNNIISSKSQGTSAEYLLGRMARDAAENPNGKAAKALARLKAGELTSVSKAAMACGIIKVKDSDRNRCPINRIKMYWKRANAIQRKELLKWLSSAEAKIKH